MAYHKVLGIDLGEVFSVVSAFNEEQGRPEAFAVPGLAPPRCIVPSVVCISGGTQIANAAESAGR